MANKILTKLLNYETGVLTNNSGNLSIANLGVSNTMLGGSIEAGKLLLQSGVLQDNGSGSLTISALGVDNVRLAGSITPAKLLKSDDFVDDGSGNLTIAALKVINDHLAGSIEAGKLLKTSAFEAEAITGNLTIKALGVTSDMIADSAIEDGQLASDYLYDDGSRAMTGNLNLSSNKVIGVAAPTSNGDATNKLYVDTNMAITPWKPTVLTKDFIVNSDNGKAKAQIEYIIMDYTLLSSSTVSLFDGTTTYTATAGGNWTVGTSNEVTATNLAAVIDAFGGGTVFQTKVWSRMGGTEWAVSIASQTAGTTPNDTWTAKLNQVQSGGMILRNFDVTTGTWAVQTGTTAYCFELGTDSAVEGEVRFAQDTDILWCWNGSEGSWMQISSPGGTYTAGDGIDITTNVVSIDLADSTTFSETVAGKALLNTSAGTINASVIDDADIDHSGVSRMSNISATAHQQPTYQTVTLIQTNIDNAYVDLSDIQVSANYVRVTFGGVTQRLNTDYTVISDGSVLKRLNWSGLGLNTAIAGDVLRVWGVAKGTQVA